MKRQFSEERIVLSTNSIFFQQIVLAITFNPPKKSVRSEVLLFPFSDEEIEVKLTCAIFKKSKWWNWDMNSV